MVRYIHHMYIWCQHSLRIINDWKTLDKIPINVLFFLSVQFIKNDCTKLGVCTICMLMFTVWEPHGCQAIPGYPVGVNSKEYQLFSQGGTLEIPFGERRTVPWLPLPQLYPELKNCNVFDMGLLLKMVQKPPLMQHSATYILAKARRIVTLLPFHKSYVGFESQSMPNSRCWLLIMLFRDKDSGVPE